MWRYYHFTSYISLGLNSPIFTVQRAMTSNRIPLLHDYSTCMLINGYLPVFNVDAVMKMVEGQPDTERHAGEREEEEECPHS